MEEYRRQVLLAQTKADSETKICLNKMWYNLLVANDSNVSQTWSRDMSNWCQDSIRNHFKRQKVNLTLG